MASYNTGKPEVCAWIRENFPPGSVVLDVGACDGLWRMLLPEYTMDAIEVFPPNADRLTGYRKVITADVCDVAMDSYDLIIFGDVIEHMTVSNARKVLQYAWTRCRDMIVAVPFLYPQDAIYGNPWERHIQDDLTPAIFAERYPGLEVLLNTERNYCYYHKGDRYETGDKGV